MTQCVQGSRSVRWDEWVLGHEPPGQDRGPGRPRLCFLGPQVRTTGWPLPTFPEAEGLAGWTMPRPRPTTLSGTQA